MSGWRRDDADEIDVGVFNQFVPIGCNVFDAKLFSDYFGAVAMATGDCDDLRAHTIAKAGDLCRAGKPRPDNSDSNR